MADPLSIGLVATALAGYHAYTRMNPTTDSVQPDPQSTVPSERYATLKNKQVFIRKDGATVFQGMETTGERMLEGKRPIDQAPQNYKDSQEFMKYLLKNPKSMERMKKQFKVKETVGFTDDMYQRAYRKWLQKKAHATGATMDQNLKAVLAENLRSQNEIMSGRQGHIYTMENEIKPILYRKNTNSGRFSPYTNPIDDSVFMVPQRGMTFAFPPVTRMGVSKHYHLKANSDSGGYYDPTRAAPARSAKVGNTFSPPEGVRNKALRTSSRQFLGTML
jgi:hypothetical protein